MFQNVGECNNLLSLIIISVTDNVVVQIVGGSDLSYGTVFFSLFDIQFEQVFAVVGRRVENFHIHIQGEKIFLGFPECHIRC